MILPPVRSSRVCVVPRMAGPRRRRFLLARLVRGQFAAGVSVLEQGRAGLRRGIGVVRLRVEALPDVNRGLVNALQRILRSVGVDPCPVICHEGTVGL